MKKEKDIKIYEKICKIVFIVLSSIILVFSFLPFVKANSTVVYGINMLFLNLPFNNNFFYSSFILLIGTGGFLSTVAFSIVSIVLNASSLNQPTAPANRIFFSLQVMSYCMMVLGITLCMTGIGKYQGSGESYSSFFTIEPIILAIILLVAAIGMSIVNIKVVDPRQLEVPTTKVHRIIGIILEVGILVLLCTDYLEDKHVALFQSYFYDVNRSTFFIVFFGLVAFISGIIGVFFKVKNLTKYSHGFQVFLSVLQVICVVFLLIILPREVKNNNSFLGGSQYKLVGPNWTVWVAFGMAVVKLINDFHIYGSVNE